MNYEEIRILLEDISILIKTINEKWSGLKIEDKVSEYSKIKNSESFWENKDYKNILIESKRFENILDSYKEINEEFSGLKELLEISKDDQNMLSEINLGAKRLLKKTKKFNISLLLSKEDDQKNCFFEINSGAGGTEAQDWAEIIFRMYTRFFEKNNFKYDLIDFSTGEEAGIKSATILVKGDYPTGILESEVGIHRLVRISPFDSAKRRHTSFCAVSLTPEAPEIKIEINPKDLRIDTYRAGGAGGQHVNKTDSAVRITHLPTGIVAQCQNERSQLQNKEYAMKVLKARLYQREKEIKEKKDSSVEKKKIEWGSQIRSYILHPYKMVKDHRTNNESKQPEKVLDGELIDFIEKYLILR